jgi:hypothetical protein
MAGRMCRRRLSDLCLLCSALILESVALFGVRSVLAAHQLEGQFTLVGESRMELPLPSVYFQVTPLAENPQMTSQVTPTISENQITLPTETLPTEAVPSEAVPSEAVPTQSSSPMADVASISTAIPSSPTLDLPSVTPALTASPEVETPALPIPPPVNSTGRVVRLVIPRLGVDRAVVLLGFTTSSQGTADWNTDKLFATANRKDLIGQTITSVNPGEGGNIVLMGHNYDNGYYAWEDAFVNIKSLTPGDQIIVYTEGGGEYHYSVQLVKKVPWREENAAEAAKHYKYLGPTPSEQLTLVTCGGANVWPWQARLYVVAVPAL